MTRWIAMIVGLLIAAAVPVTAPAADDAPSGEAPAGQQRSRVPLPEFLKVPKLQPVPFPEAGQFRSAIDRGVAFLLSDQNRNGSWGTAERTKDLNIMAPVPGAHHAFRMGTTALCLSALLELEPYRADVSSAIDRCEQFVFESLPQLRRADETALYNMWGHGYGIQALVRMYRRNEDPARREKIGNLIRMQYDYLGRYESVDGGWGYYDFDIHAKQPATKTVSFGSAAVLVAMREARDIGFEPPERLVRRAIDSLHRQQKPDFSYLYGEYLRYKPMLGVNRPGGSLGRSQACNLALRLWDQPEITDEVMTAWLDRLFSRNGWLDIGRKKPIPHESWFQVAGYFYYFGHYYAALSIEQLPPAKRGEYQAHLASILVRLQEKDGSWWDYPLYNYHQQYGTGFVLMSLLRCLPADSPVLKTSDSSTESQ
jgi:hypothetical protein